MNTEPSSTSRAVDSRPILTRPWIVWPLLIAFWTVPAVLLATQIHFLYAEEGKQVSWWNVLVWQAAGWYFWVPGTMLVLWICRRSPLTRQRWIRGTLGHAGVALSMLVLHVLYLTLITKLLGPVQYSGFSFLGGLVMWLSQRLSLDLMIYGGLVGMGYGIDSYRKYRERELQASELQTRLAQAQLQALKMQLHPHFLFNTLHAIAVLVRKGANQQAVRMLAGLSDLLRIALDNVGTQEVPLKKELEFLERYLELEQIRFQDRLQVELDIAPETLDTLVPNLILQPLVENAIRHGIAQTAAAGLVTILARREGSRLRVEVRDDGPGMPDSSGSSVHEGVGLSNTRKRLQRLYAEEHRFSLSNGEGGGAVAVVEIPVRFATS